MVGPCKEIQDSLEVWIPRRGFRIPITRFQIFLAEFEILDLGFCIQVLGFGFFVCGTWIPDSNPILRGILDSLSCILYFKSQDYGFHSKKFAELEVDVL